MTPELAELLMEKVVMAFICGGLCGAIAVAAALVIGYERGKKK